MVSASSSERRAPRVALLCAATVLAAVTAAPAAVYYGKQDALAAAFPDVEKIETRRFFLSEEKRDEIEQLARAPLGERMITAHVASRDGRVVGYAFFETHEVRTLPETLLVVVSPEGRVGKILLAAFYEPPDYEAPAAWMKQFDEATLTPDLRVNRDIQGIAGSTLTAHAVTSGIRRVLALYEVLIRADGEGS